MATKIDVEKSHEFLEMWALLETHPRFKSQNVQELPKIYQAAVRDLELHDIDLELIRSTRNKIAHGDLATVSLILDTAHSQLQSVLETAFGAANFSVYWSIQQELWKRDFSSRDDRQCLLTLYETTLGGIEHGDEISKLVRFCLGPSNFNFCRIIRNRASHPAPPPSKNEVNSALRMLEKAKSEAIELHRLTLERQRKKEEAQKLRDEERARQVEHEEIQRAAQVERLLAERRQREETAQLHRQKRARLREEEERRREEEERHREEERERNRREESQRQAEMAIMLADRARELEVTRIQTSELQNKIVGQFEREYRHRHVRLRSRRRRISALTMAVSLITLAYSVLVISLPIGTNDIFPIVISLSLIVSMICGATAQFFLASRLRLERRFRRSMREQLSGQNTLDELLATFKAMKPRHVYATDDLYEETIRAHKHYRLATRELIETMNSFRSQLVKRIEPRHEEITFLVAAQIRWGMYPLGITLTFFSILFGSWIAFFVVGAVVIVAIETAVVAASEEPGDSAIEKAEKLC